LLAVIGSVPPWARAGEGAGKAAAATTLKAQSRVRILFIARLFPLSAA